MSANPYYLSKGNHATADAGRCAMEWVAYIAGEPHTDRPVCVDQPLKSFCIDFNDALDNEQRQKLRPYLARCIGTAGDGRSSERGYLCMDWIIRTYTPTWLTLAGLIEDAARLEALPQIVDLKTAKQAGPVVHEARNRAAATRDAAWDAARDVAWDAARAAAWRTAGDVAWDVAWDVAGAAAGAAAWRTAGDAGRAATRDAARDAARAALAPTVRELQRSAFKLLDRMLPKVMIDLPEPVVCRAREVCEQPC